MAKNANNTPLTRQDFEDFKEDIKEEVNEMRDDIREVRDYMMFQKGLQSRKRDGSIDMTAIIKQMLVFLTAAAGAVVLLLQIVQKVIE